MQTLTLLYEGACLEMKDYVSRVAFFYLLVFFEGSLRCAEVDLQLFPPVLLLCETGLEQSQSLLTAVPQLFCAGPWKTVTTSIGQVS